MKRIPEEELMDDTEQAAAYAETDFSEPHNAFISYFKERFPDFKSGDVLDIGCGTGDVIIRFARAFPDVQITGVDGAGAMLDIAEQDIHDHGLQNSIMLKKCLLPDPSLLNNKYDAVISNSILHHLTEPSVLWETVKKCSKAGAPVLIMDLLRPDTVETAESLVEEYAADASPSLRKDFYNSLLAAYSADEVREQLKRSGLESLTVEQVTDRHLLIWGIL